MRNSHRGTTGYWPPTTNGAVKGGGELWPRSPLEGYSEQEMIQEAQIRQAYNRKRRHFKEMLSMASGGSPTVYTKDVMQAAKLAHIDLASQALDNSIFVCERDRAGTPRKVGGSLTKRSQRPSSGNPAEADASKVKMDTST
ncbi:MAG: hypothetical protein SGPRY_009126 [Prymnesium sp.]